MAPAGEHSFPRRVLESRWFPHWTRDDDSDSDSDSGNEHKCTPKRLRQFRARHVTKPRTVEVLPRDRFIPPQAHVDGTLTTELAETAPVAEPVSSGDNSPDSGVDSGIESGDDTASVPAPTASSSVVPDSLSFVRPVVTSIAITSTEKSSAPTTLIAKPSSPTSLSTIPTTSTTDTVQSTEPPTTTIATTEKTPTTTTVSSQTTTSLSTDPRKQFGSPPGFTDGSPFSSTESDIPEFCTDAEMAEMHEHHHGLGTDAAKALVGVGSAGGVIVLAALAWLIWRYVKKSQDRRSSTWSPPPPPPDSERPRRHIRILANISFLKKRFANRGWSTIEEPYAESLQEKQQGVSAARINSYYAPEKLAAVPAAYTQEQDVEAEKGMGVGHEPNQSFSSTGGQYNTYRAPYNKHASEISSLSSGFGDGDIVIPQDRPISNSDTTNSKNNYTVNVEEFTLRPPPPAQYRETMYTETSEDAAPRFRTVNSWVRQQTGRVKRAVQAPATAPPEPEFTMMMPDGEEPRRADQFGVAK